MKATQFFYFAFGIIFAVQCSRGQKLSPLAFSNIEAHQSGSICTLEAALAAASVSSNIVAVGQEMTWVVSAKSACTHRFLLSRQDQADVSFDDSMAFIQKYDTPGTYKETVTVSAIDSSGKVLARQTITSSSIEASATSPSLQCMASVFPSTPINVMIDGSGNVITPHSFDIQMQTTIPAKLVAITTAFAQANVWPALPSSVGTNHLVSIALNKPGKHYLILEVEDASNATVKASCLQTVQLNIVTLPPPPTITLLANGVSDSVSVDISTEVNISVVSNGAVNCTVDKPLTNVVAGQSGGIFNLTGKTTALGASMVLTATCVGDGGTTQKSVSIKALKVCPILTNFPIFVACNNPGTYINVSNTLTLPSDAVNINVMLDDIWVDSGGPKLNVNGISVISQDDHNNDVRREVLNRDLSQILQAGDNTFSGSIYNHYLGGGCASLVSHLSGTFKSEFCEQALPLPPPASCVGSTQWWYNDFCWPVP